MCSAQEDVVAGVPREQEQGPVRRLEQPHRIAFLVSRLYLANLQPLLLGRRSVTVRNSESGVTSGGSTWP